MNKPFNNVISYAKISGHPELFKNETTALNCVILGWGKSELGYPNDGANIASVQVKYGPGACEVPPDKYIIFIK